MSAKLTDDTVATIRNSNVEPGQRLHVDNSTLARWASQSRPRSG